MFPGTVVANTILKRLQDSARAGKIDKVSFEDIGANPRHRVPATIGQIGITVNITGAYSRYIEQIKFTNYTFEVIYIRRIREIPNDEFESLWINSNEIPDFHDLIGSLIPSYTTLKLTTNILEEQGFRFKPKGIYQHLASQLAPTPLYSSYFGSVQNPPSNKIAGFKTISTFRSPDFYELRNPQSCIDV